MCCKEHLCNLGKKQCKLGGFYHPFDVTEQPQVIRGEKVSTEWHGGMRWVVGRLGGISGWIEYVEGLAWEEARPVEASSTECYPLSSLGAQHRASYV